jgi:4'-phosphopantetheinyl transferase
VTDYPAAEKLRFDFTSFPTASTPRAGVDLWFLDLSEFAHKSHAEFSSFVSSDELSRANQFKNSSAQFIATRLLLRNVLAHYTGLSAQEIVFERREHGKPFLGNAPVPIYFNLSHCNTLAVLAVSAYGEIGVDIETTHKRNYLKIAKRYFHGNELQYLQNCSEAGREILFYKLWTLKEAFLKATGNGIASGLDKIFFHFDDDTIKADFNPALNVQENEWQFHQEFIASNTLVAVALNATEAIKRQWLDGNSLLRSLLQTHAE